MTIVFLPGSGYSGIVWEQQLSFFENSVAINFPGHPDGDVLNSVDDIAQWLINYIEESKLLDLILVGHSLGSAVALKVALLGRVEIKALILIGAGARLKVMPQLLDSLARSVESHGDVPDYFLTANYLISEPLRSKINLSVKGNGANVMLSDLLACNSFDVMENLADIHMPVQLIVGDQDQMTPLKYASFLKENLPQAELVVIKGGTHMVFAEQAEHVNRQIQGFLEKI